jgi:hypothetical protein
MDSVPPIDITNNEDIRAKLPELEDLIKRRRRELDKLDATVDKLAAQAGVKRQRPTVKARVRRNGAGGERPAGPIRRTSRIQVREIIEDIGGPATVAEVTEKTNPPIKQKTVGWALWKEAEQGAIRTVANGVYAPLSYQPEELVPANAERGDGP